MSLRIGVVILNWNSPGDTLHCVDSVFASDEKNFELVIVDNGSTDGSVEIITASYPRLEVIKTGQNLGFSAGNNVGIRHLLARGVDAVLLLNNDAVVFPDTLRNLRQAAESYPEAGFYGAKILRLEDPSRLLSAGGRVINGWETTLVGRGEIDQGQYDSGDAIDFLSGSALLVHCKALDRVGWLDPDYFLYYEDVDLCRRGVQAGFSPQLVPQARVLHPDTQQRDEASWRVTYYTARNSLMFARKQKLGLRTTLRIWKYHLHTLLSWSLRPRWKHKTPQRRALARALWDGARKQVGRAAWIQ